MKTNVSDLPKLGAPVTSFEMQLAKIPARDREAVRERAAIMEFEGNKSRAQAEWDALMDWKRGRT
jgi:hypothetical protein